MCTSRILSPKWKVQYIEWLFDQYIAILHYIMPQRYIAYISLLRRFSKYSFSDLHRSFIIFYIFNNFKKVKWNKIYINRPLIVLDLEKNLQKEFYNYFYKHLHLILLIKFVEFIHKYIFIKLNKNLFNYFVWYFLF